VGHERASRASALGVTEASGVCSTGGFLVVPIGRVIVEREREREREVPQLGDRTHLPIRHSWDSLGTCGVAFAGSLRVEDKCGILLSVPTVHNYSGYLLAFVFRTNKDIRGVL